MTSAVAGAGRASTAGAGTAGASSSSRTAAGTSSASTSTTQIVDAASRSRSQPRRGDGPAEPVAGLILGFLAWAWLILPLLRGGPDEVRRVLKAKFVNKDAQGRWLP